MRPHPAAEGSCRRSGNERYSADRGNTVDREHTAGTLGGDQDFPDRRRSRLHDLHPGSRRRGCRRAGNGVRRARSRRDRIRGWGTRRPARGRSAGRLRFRTAGDPNRDRASAQAGRETVAEPRLPLAVGIGLDAGEAVLVDGGFRGGALNLAARLCSVAEAGEVLATREVAHLARKVDGVRYVERGSMRFKGLDEPIEVIKVQPELEDLRAGSRFPPRARTGRVTGRVCDGDAKPLQGPACVRGGGRGRFLRPRGADGTPCRAACGASLPRGCRAKREREVVGRPGRPRSGIARWGSSGVRALDDH